MNQARTVLFAVALFAAPAALAAPDTAVSAPSLPVRGGSLTLKVPDFLQARTAIVQRAAQAGAQIVGGETVVDAKGRKSGTLALSLPADRLPELLPGIRAVGVLASDTLSSTDRTAEYDALAGRIEQLRKHQTRLDDLLHSRRNLRGSDILYVQERLFRAGVDESELMGQRAQMERRSHTASLSLTLFEPLPIVPPPVPRPAPAREAFAHTFTNSVKRAEMHRDRFFGTVATALAFAAVYAPLWGAALLLLAAIARFVWVRRAVIGRAVQTLATRAQTFVTRSLSAWWQELRPAEANVPAKRKDSD